MMEGIVATSYAQGDKFYIDPAKLLPLARFLPQPKYVCLSLFCPSSNVLWKSKKIVLYVSFLLNCQIVVLNFVSVFGKYKCYIK